MVNKKLKEQATLEAVKLAEIYKAGFIDGYAINSDGKVSWKRIYKRCGKAFNKRFLA